MIPSRDLAARFEAYGDWRRRLSAGDLGAARMAARAGPRRRAGRPQASSSSLERLHQDKLVVAFVAEFSRGKSELINAIFFADFGQRLLPSSAGRTTMCPTELLHDPSRPPSIRLLPIETRLKRRDGRRVQELRGRVGDVPARPVVGASGWPKRCRACRR